jgi:hypothetical protein
MSNLWQIPLPAYLEEHKTNNGVSASEGLRTALQEPPRVDNRISPIIDWILTIASYLRLLIAITFKRMYENVTDLDNRVTAIEDRSSHTETTNIAKGWHHVRCTKCHARGHMADTCRTQNPEVVRRRIANNKKANKRTSPVIPDPPYAPAPHMYPPTSQWTAFMVDATELRRRKNQSNRDRRRSNKSKSKGKA